MSEAKRKSQKTAIGDIKIHGFLFTFYGISVILFEVSDRSGTDEVDREYPFDMICESQL